MKRTTTMVLTAGAAVSCLLWWLSPPRSADNAVAPMSLYGAKSSASSEPAKTDREQHERSSSHGPSTPMEEAARPFYSLSGTEPDGGFTLSEQGFVLVDQALKRRFDYYLAALGELSLAQVRQALKLDSEGQLDPAQTLQVMTWFDRYTAYLRAVDDIPSGADMEANYHQLLALRRQWLGESMAAAMFDAEEAYTQHQLAIRAVRSDRLLSELERQQLLDELDTTRPREWVMSEGRSLGHREVEAQTRAFEAQGVVAAERFSERRAQYGEAAAHRMAALDVQRTEWRETVNEYFHHREQIAHLDPAAQLAALTTVEGAYSASDRRRLRALWRYRDSVKR